MNLKELIMISLKKQIETKMKKILLDEKKNNSIWFYNYPNYNRFLFYFYHNEMNIYLRNYTSKGPSLYDNSLLFEITFDQNDKVYKFYRNFNGINIIGGEYSGKGYQIRDINFTQDKIFEPNCDEVFVLDIIIEELINVNYFLEGELETIHPQF